VVRLFGAWLLPGVTAAFSLEGLWKLNSLYTLSGTVSVFAPWINFEHHWLQRALLDASILEANRERAQSMDYGPLTRQQESCTPGRTGHERLFLGVENKNHGSILSLSSHQESHYWAA
jgi:hypothetical protein